MRKSTILATAVLVSATAVHGLATPAGATHGTEIKRYSFEQAWPKVVGGNVEFEWKVEEGES